MSPVTPLRHVNGSPKAAQGTADRVPAPMTDAAYHGILGDVVRAIAPETEAAPEGLLLQVLVMVGNMIGRSPHFKVAATRHALNLFVGVVGRSSRGRKGTAADIARDLLGPLDDSWLKLSRTGLSSGEGLIWAVRDPITKIKAVKKKGGGVSHEEVLEDPGIADKRLLVVESEFASVLQRMVREGNTLSALLRQAFDGGDLRALTKGSPAVATAPHISIVGQITSDELRRELTSTDTANGFANRFLWCYVDRARLLPDGGRLPHLSTFQNRLSDALAFVREEVDEIHRDPHAQRLWHQIYGSLTADRPGLVGKVTSRAEALVMRLACLYAVCDRSHVVTVPHLRAALAVWRYCRDSAAHIFGDALGNQVADDILASLKDEYPASLTRTQISELFRRNRSAAELSRAIKLLVEAGLAQTERDDSREGRPVERVWHTPRGEDDETYEIDEIDEITTGTKAGGRATAPLNSLNSSISSLPRGAQK